MDQVYVLRHKVLVEGLSVRDVARQLGISRNTVRRYLEGAAPGVRGLMHSSRDFAWLYPRQAQICFLDGHVRAFAHFGAVPQRLLYDNLKPAVTRVLVGSERELSPRFVAMASHYVFEPCFARPATG